MSRPVTSTVSWVTQRSSRKIARVQGQLVRSLGRKENVARTSLVRLVRPTAEQLATSTAKSLAADDGSLRTFSAETTRVDPVASSLTSHWNAELRPKNGTIIGTVGDDLAANQVTTPRWQPGPHSPTQASWDLPSDTQVAFTKSSLASSFLPQQETIHPGQPSTSREAFEISPTFTHLLTAMNMTEFDNMSLECANLSSVCNSTNETLFGDAAANDMIVKDYWALLLLLFPLLTVFGNVLVILSVYKERSLQTATNYFIVSLAIADLLVATLVMPFAVYVLVNGQWDLPPFVCDFYVAMDVTCSTSSIFNLVAISIDRFIAVTQPIKYARHKNHGRIWLTIVLVWVISAAIGSPIVLGLNHSPSRDPTLCVFYNTDFVIYSSLSSFYIPCIIMVFLYYRIFKAIRERAKKAVASRKSNPVMDNLAHTKRLAETALGASPVLPLATIGDGSQVGSASSPIIPSISKPRLHQARIEEEDKITDQGSASQDEEEDYERDAEEMDGWEEGGPLPRDTSTEFILTTQSELASKLKPDSTLNGDTNGNQDSGYVASIVDDKNHSRRNAHERRKAGSSKASTRGTVSSSHAGSTCSGNKDAKAGSRFTIYKVNKASRKKREKSSAKKERKATKTLAIVLGVFLICWVPFFTCNIMDAICSKLQLDCQPGVTAFILTTWLGYINSFINPVIYTIFNLEFRKAFKRILVCAD